MGCAQAIECKSGTLAQPVEQRTFNPLVGSSNLPRPTKKFKKPVRDRRLFSLPHALLWQALVMNHSFANNPPADVVCMGGINLDRKLKALDALHAGSSNPCIVSESAGGVARNVAENLARLGMRVSLCGQVGHDTAAQKLLSDLQTLGVDTSACFVSEIGSTGSYTAVLDAHGELVLGMADMALTEQLLPPLLISAGLPKPAALWLADMNLPAESLAWLAQQANAAGQRLVMLAVSEPKMQRLLRDLRGVDTLVCNLGELVALGKELDWPHDVQMEQPRSFTPIFDLLRATGLQQLVVTQGSAGVVCISANCEPVRVLPPPLDAALVRDVSGAGDAFCAGLCASFLRYPAGTLAAHAERAMRLAALAVQSEHTVSPAITPDLI
jgi:pseudouridine kinase